MEPLGRPDGSGGPRPVKSAPGIHLRDAPPPQPTSGDFIPLTSSPVAEAPESNAPLGALLSYATLFRSREAQVSGGAG